MDKYRIVLIILNCLCAGLVFFLFFDEGLPKNGEQLFIYFLMLTPIFTLPYLIINTNKDNEESLFSLWLKLKKKNIKEELEK